MTNEETKLIQRCAELTAEHAASKKPNHWEVWSLPEWEEIEQHGPRYLSGHWFGPMPEWQRMRYRRAVDVLEGKGLMTTHRRRGYKLTNVALTEAGREVAQQF